MPTLCGQATLTFRCSNSSKLVIDQPLVSLSTLDMSLLFYRAERTPSTLRFMLISVVESELGTCMLSFVIIIGSGWRHDILSLVVVGLGVLKSLLGVAKSFSCKWKMDPLATLPTKESTIAISEEFRVIIRKGTHGFALKIASFKIFNRLRVKPSALNRTCVRKSPLFFRLGKSLWCRGLKNCDTIMGSCH